MGNVYFGEMSQTPAGDLWLAADEQGIVAIHFGGSQEEFVGYIEALSGQTAVYQPEKVADLAEQLTQYFDKDRQDFDLPIHWDLLTEFQKTALQAVYEIPYGQLCTYNDIAHQIGNPKAIRAVGRANATNPIPIVVPCHRVIGSNGKLHGYGGGLETKAKLLRIEGSWLL